MPVFDCTISHLNWRTIQNNLHCTSFVPMQLFEDTKKMETLCLLIFLCIYVWLDQLLTSILILYDDVRFSSIKTIWLFFPSLSLYFPLLVHNAHDQVNWRMARQSRSGHNVNNDLTQGAAKGKPYLYSSLQNWVSQINLSTE